ncbi:rhodanese-like domain-containing protein [Thalassotalea euphylliae]|uniref:Rhodanese-like domain-containing protein n=1 Tax=Thalassotalea euphylliae TaxID=1655234 RepID=A0A3E0UBS0_9GAMM|nr:rhodanese-like domain-containing protein [Thalassotalea euphylliae]REL34290.1 rhodanese-like domain-containing protein [Thalassotalea euphylliae]
MNKLAASLQLLLVTVTSFVWASERPSVSQEHVLSLVNAPLTSGYTLLDVRTAEEFKTGHIQSAINISHTELANNLTLLPSDKAANIIVYCRSGRRAAVAEQLLRKQGYSNIWHLTGDIIAWQANGLPLKTLE